MCIYLTFSSRLPFHVPAVALASKASIPLLVLAVPVCFVKVEDWGIFVLSLVLCYLHAVSEVYLRLSGVKLPYLFSSALMLSLAALFTVF